MDNFEVEVNPSVAATGTTVKLVGWGHFDFNEARRLEKEGKPPVQKDYWDVLKDRENVAGIVDQIEHLVIADIVKHKYCFDGEAHQNYKYGCPIVEVDGERLYYFVSWRYWGGIMADAWVKIDGRSYDYMDFYMGVMSDKANFRGPIVGIDINEDGSIIDTLLEDGVGKAIDDLYAEKQRLIQENSEMRHVLWKCYGILKNVPDEEMSEIVSKVFRRDVELFCHVPGDWKKIDEDKVKSQANDKWIDLVADMAEFTKPFAEAEAAAERTIESMNDTESSSGGEGI